MHVFKNKILKDVDGELQWVIKAFLGDGGCGGGCKRDCLLWFSLTLPEEALHLYQEGRRLKREQRNRGENEHMNAFDARLLFVSQLARFVFCFLALPHLAPASVKQTPSKAQPRQAFDRGHRYQAGRSIMTKNWWHAWKAGIVCVVRFSTTSMTLRAHRVMNRHHQ